MPRETSEKKILSALEKLLENNQEIGINIIAKEAGLNKVLIYRYFGGLEGLLETYAKRINLWRPLREEFEQGLIENRWESLRETVKWFFTRYRENLLTSPIYLRLLKEELKNPNPLTKALEVEREEEALKINRLFTDYISNSSESVSIDVQTFGAFVMSGITYLTLKSTQVRWFSGLDLKDNSSWEKFDQLWLSLLDQ